MTRLGLNHVLVLFPDEIYGINQSTAHFPADRFSSSDDSNLQSGSTDKKTIILNSGEELYTEMRDKNFNAIGRVLSRRANEISKQLDERHNDKSVQDIKRFVERLPNMMAYKKSLATHTTIAEMLKETTSSDDFLDALECEQEFLTCSDADKINPFIEDLIANQTPFNTIIRLICMQSYAGSGLKQKVLDYYKRELVQVYGIEKLLAISNLEKAGLLKVQAGNRTYAVMRKVGLYSVILFFFEICLPKSWLHFPYIYPRRSSWQWMNTMNRRRMTSATCTHFTRRWQFESLNVLSDRMDGRHWVTSYQVCQEQPSRNINQQPKPRLPVVARLAAKFHNPIRPRWFSFFSSEDARSRRFRPFVSYQSRRTITLNLWSQRRKLSTKIHS